VEKLKPLYLNGFYIVLREASVQGRASTGFCMDWRLGSKCDAWLVKKS